ncbi:MAG: CHRD domain-containing protein [Gammaproteobacteria bacterium]
MSIQLNLVSISTVALFGLFLLPLHSSGEVITFQLSISGDQEVPGPGDEDGQASGTLSIDNATNLISWSFTYLNIANPVAMHIHSGAAGEGGGVLVPLNVEMGGEAGILVGSTTGDAASVMAILASPSDYYVNIHNADFRPGAIRGQLGN